MCNEQKCFSWIKTARDHILKHHNILIEELKINSGKYIKENVHQSNCQEENLSSQNGEIVDQRKTTISNDINEETEQKINNENLQIGKKLKRKEKYSKEKTEKCSFCEKYFTKKRIKLHVREIHLKNIVYKCKFCSLTFPKVHQR